MRRLIAASLAASALALTACGDDDSGNAGPAQKRDYISSVKQVTVALQTAFNSVASGLSSQDPKQISAALGEGADALERTAKDLKAIKVPGEIDASHDKLVAGVDDFAGAFESAAKDTGAATREELGAQLAQLSQSDGARKIQEALNELKGKGYDIQAAPADGQTTTAG